MNERLVDRRSVGRVLEVALLTGVAFAVRLALLDQPQHVDEFNHILGARSLLTDGTLSIEGGEPYTRGKLFTYLVAGSFLIFGESLAAARVPGLIAGSALVGVLFIWVRSVTGSGAAWAAGLLLCLSPLAISWSPIARFYSVQAFLFFCGAALLYHLTYAHERRGTQALLGLGTALLLFVALRLQILTAVGIAGLLLWLALAKGPAFVRRARSNPHRRWIGGALVVFLGLLVVFLVQSGIVSGVWSLFRYSAYWAAENRDNVRFYHWRLLEDYPTLWTLFPFLILVTAIRHPRVALFCGTIFTLAFLFHSFAAWKTLRYIYYALPMLFVLGGVTIAEGLRAAHHGLKRIIHERLWPALPTGFVNAASVTLLTGAVLFTALSNSAFMYSLRMTAGQFESVATDGHTRWDLVIPTLRPLVDSSSVVVSSSEFAPLYYFGRQDVSLSANRLYHRDGFRPEFFPSAKLNQPQISTAESLRRLMDCHPDGLVLVERIHWRREHAVPAATADFLLEATDTIPLPEEARLLAFTWNHANGAPRSDCDLRSLAAAASADP